MSRLDRFLLSEEWCLMWPNCIQIAQLRGLSNHCPIMLSVDEENWGPRPFRLLKCWQDIPGYNQFVCDKWRSFQVSGWASFVLKEKFKLIKKALKEWHVSHTQNLSAKVTTLKNRQANLDGKGEEKELSKEEFEELHGITAEIHTMSRLNTSICWQQSRLNWLREGDANSKYFHSVMAGQRRHNTLCSICVNGVMVEGVQHVRQAVFDHFHKHFCAPPMVRPRVGHLQFRQLSFIEKGTLTKPFSMDEVKAAVWDCDSFKSPGLDGINFGFIKNFWNVMKGDMLRFVLKFHRNGKLSKGIKATFIALIPKVDSPQIFNDFRPISLVGCLYKIIAKILANRLRQVIGSVVADVQSTFVKNRQILNGILIANEVVDEARKTKKELLLFKVDFEKAYDSVD